MNYFWDKQNFDSDRIAFITEADTEISYREINKQIEAFCQQHFNQHRKLVFIETSNTLAAIVAYFACLRHQYPVLLLDQELKAEFKQHLVKIYNPNIYISKTSSAVIQVENLTNFQHSFADELALLLSTSGSTGAPKLVKLSRTNIQSNAISISQYLEMTVNDRAITLMPMHYSYGLSVLNSHLAIQASVVISQNSIISREIWAQIKQHKVTSISGVPFIYEMLQKLRFNRMDLPSLRYLTQAGGKLKPDLVKQFAEWAEQKNLSFYVMYGQTEAAPRISYLDPRKTLIKPESIGKPIPGGQLYLMDEKGTTINKPGLSGELVYKGENVMLGYAEQASELATADTIESLNTGDIAYFDEDGDYFIVGRVKRFIKLYGLRFSLDQLEMHLLNLGFQAVCGGKDDNLRVAVVGLKDNDNSIKATLVDDYKINVKSIEVFKIGEISRTSSGKIDYKNIFR